MISAVHRQAANTHLSQDGVVFWGQTEAESGDHFKHAQIVNNIIINK